MSTKNISLLNSIMLLCDADFIKITIWIFIKEILTNLPNFKLLFRYSNNPDKKGHSF